MKKFVHMNEFRNLNIGFALDEGMASPNDEYALFYAERCIWRKFLLKIIFVFVTFMKCYTPTAPYWFLLYR